MRRPDEVLAYVTAPRGLRGPMLRPLIMPRPPNEPLGLLAASPVLPLLRWGCNQGKADLFVQGERSSACGAPRPPPPPPAKGTSARGGLGADGPGSAHASAWQGLTVGLSVLIFVSVSPARRGCCEN